MFAVFRLQGRGVDDTLTQLRNCAVITLAINAVLSFWSMRAERKR